MGRQDFAAVQEQYPTRTGRWTFEAHRLVTEGAQIVSEVTVIDGEQSARVVAFSVVQGAQIVSQVEYWPAATPRSGETLITWSRLYRRTAFFAFPIDPDDATRR